MGLNPLNEREPGGAARKTKQPPPGVSPFASSHGAQPRPPERWPAAVTGETSSARALAIGPNRGAVDRQPVSTPLA